MKKYNVKVFTTSDDIILDCNMDEFSLGEFLDFDDANFIKIEDDTKELTYIFNVAQIVCVEYKEINEIP
jgi:hypothetical protein